MRSGSTFPLLVLLTWVFAALGAPLFSLTPNEVGLQRILEPPGAVAWFGFDDLGRPLFDRLIAGAQSSLLVAAAVVTSSALIGILIGLLAGYLGGWIDLLLVRLIDVFLAFPGILLAIALAAVMGPGLDNLIIALAAVGWVGYARLARAQALSLRQREYVTAAIALGSRTPHILLHHLLPLMSAPLIIEATFGVAGVVVAEAGLSFLGLGVQPPDASWGNMIRDGAGYMLVAPHMVLAPGLAMSLVALSLNLLGDQLRDRLDSRAI
ncbi:ABC transporter permease [endosymbiont of Ridgeia piscesae]|jgi:peptide/nickel transport system permease protein|uniref:ABC-type dipeptide/oligopeptide/nickel transport system, permease component n=1 Tax=endosymbiont of Ridgeia piscesae TaxID=54398 RepID=A0A0T5ZAM6_9GAMM|nr:ABC transporter permease [endosymbiont of Ridgeia piscesae]KRT56187.1 ABC-type dipeptide/oligopeptide/nickel transport system, permease component [endosymbiont of Ridgeia piscesae]KRT59534.1 peptide/nickel transport system permease protein [endosymbiont of Ridgeia piscesae]